MHRAGILQGTRLEESGGGKLNHPDAGNQLAGSWGYSVAASAAEAGFRPKPLLAMPGISCCKHVFASPGITEAAERPGHHMQPAPHTHLHGT